LLVQCIQQVTQTVSKLAAPCQGKIRGFFPVCFFLIRN